MSTRKTRAFRRLGQVLMAAATGACVLILVDSRSSASPGETAKVSLRADGTATDSPSRFSDISADGRFVVFWTMSNFVADSLGGGIFVRDLVLSTNERANLRPDGEIEGVNQNPAISGDGRFVAFETASGVMLRDLTLNTTQTVAEIGKHPDVSGDGRYVSFESSSPTLVADDTNGVPDIFVFDTVSASTERVSLSGAGVQADVNSQHARLSPNGRFVVFQSLATNLVPNDTNLRWDVFLRDRLLATTVRVSVNTASQQGNDDSLEVSASRDAPVVDASGTLIAFTSAATNLTEGDSNGGTDIFLRDMVAGTTTRVSVSDSGSQANRDSFKPSISADGRMIEFTSVATNLVAGGTNGQSQIFVRDAIAGTTLLISVESSGVQGNAFSNEGEISADGRFISFYSASTNLVFPDANGVEDVFLHELCGDAEPDEWHDCPRLNHEGPKNTEQGEDNCVGVANFSQGNNDGNYIDHSPPYMPGVDDKTWPDSDGAGDACDNDNDNDGISDTDEADGGTSCAAITEPLLRDTDADRFLDGAECVLGTDPTSFASKPLVTACGGTTDVDGDKLTERVEFCFYGTDPNNSDTDGDKALDGGNDGCEAASFNHDRIVNVADMGMLATAISNVSFRVVSVDVNKDGAWNPADQGIVASFISPSGQCPG